MQSELQTALLNKKFWEWLIAYFPLIWQGPHKKRLQQFFISAGTRLQSHCHAMIGGYTDTPKTLLSWHRLHRKQCIQQFFFVSRIHCCRNVFTKMLPSNDSGDIRMDTQTNRFMKYAIEIGSGAMIHILNIIKIGSGIQKLIGRIQRNTVWWLYEHIFIFQNNESNLKK
jgi:hypothetical protein